MTVPPAQRSLRKWLFPAAALIVWLLVLLSTQRASQPPAPPVPKPISLSSLQSSNHLQLIDHYAMQGQIKAMLFASPYLYLGRGVGGLTILKSEDDQPLSLVRHYPDQSLVSPLAFCLRDDLLFIADRFRGLAIVDISSPENPRLVFERQVEGIATGILVHEELLILSLGAEGIALYDIAEPAAPKELASYFQFIDYTKEVAVYGSYFYLADNRDGGLKVLTRKSNGLFELVRQLDTNEYCDGVTVDGDLLIIRNRLEGLGVYSLEDPAEPQLLSTVGRSSDMPMDLAVTGGYLLAAFYYNGLTLISLANPERLELLDRVNYGGGAQNVALCLAGDRVFLGDKQRGVLLYRLVLEREKTP